MLRHFVHRHYTSQCHLCGLTIRQLNDTIWCEYCLRYFEPTPRCRRCGLPTLTDTLICGQCLTDPPPWHNLYCIGDYQPPLTGYIHQLKHQKKHWLAKDLAYLLAQRITEPAPLITCVPLHWTRLVRRGFNQSSVIAEHLVRQRIHTKCQVRYNSQIFKRIKATPPQQELDKRERIKNLNNAFIMRKAPENTHIAIVDDVVTTGSTIKKLCTLLLDFGVQRIDIYCICRTPEPSEKT